MERGRSPLVSIPPFRAGIFKASGSTDPMWFLERAQKRSLRAPIIVSMSPPGYPSAWLRPRIASFRFARQDHCSARRDPRFSQLPGCPSLDQKDGRAPHSGNGFFSQA